MKWLIEGARALRGLPIAVALVLIVAVAAVAVLTPALCGGAMLGEVEPLSPDPVVTSGSRSLPSRPIQSRGPEVGR